MHRPAKVVLVAAILFGTVFSPAFNARVQTKQLVANDPPSNFSKTLDFARKVRVFARIPVFQAACESSAFTCEEIIQLASFDTVQDGLSSWGPEWWEATVMVFAEGRSNKGCISDPSNAKSLVDTFAKNWESRRSTDADYMNEIQDRLAQVFITHNEVLKPAEGAGAPPMQLQTGHRTDKAMKELVGNIEQMIPNSFFYRSGSVFEKEFRPWLKQIRSTGEQFSGPQLVALVNALPLGVGLAQAVSVLLEYLEQYVTGVTCNEVNTIQRRMAILFTDADYRIAGLAVLKSLITDPQNKVAIVADPSVQSIGMTPAQRTEEVLRDVVVGLPPKNNPIFGVVRGNPVILLVDESDSMDVNFTLGNDTFPRRRFCHSQLEMVLEGLPPGIYFNVIQYDRSPVKIFQHPVLASKSNINVAMNKVSSTWRNDYIPGQDPMRWLRKVQGFSLSFRHQFSGSTTNVMEALQLAYATAALPSEQTEDPATKMAKMDELEAGTRRDHGAVTVAKDMPQMYLLISRQPGGAGQILNKIDELDNGRNIAVNSITFSNAFADPWTKQFGKDLASKTGGFFRSIEQA